MVTSGSILLPKAMSGSMTLLKFMLMIQAYVNTKHHADVPGLDCCLSHLLSCPNQATIFKRAGRATLLNSSTVKLTLVVGQEINTTTYDDYILISQSREKWNQGHFALTFPKTPMPDIKKKSGPSELEVTVSRQEKRKIEEGQKPTHVWINQFVREVFLKSSFSLAFITQAPLKYLYNPQTHYIMAETRKPKDDKRRKTLKKNFKGKINSCVINLESMRTIINGKPEILDNTEKHPSKSPHKSKLPKKLNSTSETNLESNNSKKTLKMSLRNDNKNSMNFIWMENAATCCKDNPNTDSEKNVEEFSDEISECMPSSNMNLILRLNEFRSEFTDIDEWSTNCSQNNAKKPSKKGAKKEKDSDIDSGDSKDTKKNTKKKEKKESRKKKDTESDAESGDSKDGKKRINKDKKRESKKKRDTDSTGGESVESKVSKKDKKEKKSPSKKYTESSGSESIDSKGAKKVKKQPKKNVMRSAVSTDSESDAASKKGKKDEKKETKGRRKPVKDTESTDADSESEGDSAGKKGEKKDKKITKKGDKKETKKNAASSGSESDSGVKKEKKKKIKDVGSYTDSSSDTSSKAGRRKISRRSDTESEESSELRVVKTTDDSDASSTDSKRGMTGTRRGYRTLSKKTTFREKGKRSLAARIPSSRERLPFPPCEPFKASPKPIRVCKCKKSSIPPPKPRHAPLPGVEWIHKLL
ncbi:cylicin-1 [Apodemus sylvaticus]|uniref:cylicin-1 n=1 Tax=Apodemus sylvaticus TaxID=10129 RepID=UPI0022439488|nr:cylicin-1 [Apodemus sylvaticus]